MFHAQLLPAVCARVPYRVSPRLEMFEIKIMERGGERREGGMGGCARKLRTDGVS